jgi:SUMO ligase MMS21 Smc5/6 complex component
MDNAPDPEEAQKIFALSRKYEVKSQELTSAVSRLVSKVDAAAEYKQSLDSSKYSRYFNEANYVPNQTQDEAWKEYEESQQAGEKTTVLGFMMISELIEREPLHKDAANRVEKLLHEAITTFELEQDQVTLPNRLLRIQLLRKDREGVEKVPFLFLLLFSFLVG